MAGHGDGRTKREGGAATRVQLQLNPEVQVLANLGEESAPSNSNSCSSSSSSNLGEADSEGDAEVVDSPCEPVTIPLPSARFMYSPLDGGSDSDSELDLDDVELFCEEALALLAHEIVCCDCDSDLESEEEDDDDNEEEFESEMESGSDQIDGYGQDNLSASTYQLMFSEEDEEELQDGGDDKKDECPYVVESVLLLEEDQESEEKSDPKSAPDCL